MSKSAILLLIHKLSLASRSAREDTHLPTLTAHATSRIFQ